MEDFVPVARMTRVNKLLHQSIADILRRRWSRETVAITLTAVECSGDLRDAKVRYSVLGDDKREAVDFFRKNVMVTRAGSEPLQRRATPRLAGVSWRPCRERS